MNCLVHYSDYLIIHSSCNDVSATKKNRCNKLFGAKIQPWWFALIYYPIVLFVLTVLCCVSCRDPGLMERVTDEEAADNGWFWNEQVGSYRPAGAMYCRECKVRRNLYASSDE